MGDRLVHRMAYIGHTLSKLRNRSIVPDITPISICAQVAVAVLDARISAARQVLHATEISGNWDAIEIAHGRLLRLELAGWLGG